MFAIGAVLAGGLFVYLIVYLLWPEAFEGWGRP